MTLTTVVAEPTTVTTETPETPASPTPPDPANPAPADAVTPEGATPTPEASSTPEVPTPPAAPVVPETYTLALSEGSLLDASLLERAAVLSRELGLPNDAAQRVVALAESEVAQHLELLGAADAVGGEGYKARVAQYEAQSLEAEDLGNGDQDQLMKIAIRGQQVLAKLGDDELREFLHATGVGSHRAWLRFTEKVARAFGEGEFVQPSAAPTAGSRDPADVLYNSRSKPAAQE